MLPSPAPGAPPTPFPAMLIALALALAPVPARADDDQAAWFRPVTTGAITFGSIYMLALSAVQTTRFAMAALVPMEWLLATQTFGIPLVLVPLMSQAVPAVRQWAPDAADQLCRVFSPDPG